MRAASATKAAPLRESASASGRAGAWAAFVLVLMFSLILLGTRSTFFGDTPDYVGDIASVLEGHAPATHLLDFGHVIWRPIGAWMTGAPAHADDPALRRQIALHLIHFNLVAAALCAAAMWELLRLVKGIHVGAALLSCCAFLATNGFILLSRAGTAWLAGLTCLLIACCFALQASRRDSWKLAICAALFLATSVLFWVPYVLGASTVACTSLLVWEEGKASRRLLVSALRILPLAALLTLGAIAAAVAARHISTPGQLLEWVRSAGHGEDRDRQWLRMLFGLPRSFFIMGNDGVLWKQFLFRDPYAGVGWAEIIRASGWKLTLFYATTGVTLLYVARRWRWLLLWVLSAVVPTLALAMAFEAGSVERYLALYPAVFVVFAWMLSQPDVLPARVLISLFCGVLIVTNLWANSKPRIDRERARSLARVGMIEAGHEAGNQALTVYTLNIRDDLETLYDPNDRSLDNVPAVLPLIPTLGPEIANWRGLFGQRMLTTWHQGGQIWIARRAWADRPQREWNWVEGDDWRVHWKDFHAVLSPFQIDAQVGGMDGFNRIANTPENRAQAAKLIRHAGPADR
jgi:hypothetical protein